MLRHMCLWQSINHGTESNYEKNLCQNGMVLPIVSLSDAKASRATDWKQFWKWPVKKIIRLSEAPKCNEWYLWVVSTTVPVSVDGNKRKFDSMWRVELPTKQHIGSLQLQAVHYREHQKNRWNITSIPCTEVLETTINETKTRFFKQQS